MPYLGRVANLFRSSAERHHLSSVKASLTRTSNPLDRAPSPSTTDDTDADGELHDHDDNDNDDAASTATGPSRRRLSGFGMQREDDTHKRRRRLPFSLSWPGKEEERPAPAGLKCVIESPPVVFHGASDMSTGALVSGQLVLEVLDERLEVDNLEARIVVKIVQKRPFQGHCGECGGAEEELKQWSFLRHPVTLLKGTHRFPFSNLLEGNNPVTTETPLVSVTYALKAEAIVARQPFAAGTSVTPIRLEFPLPVRRSLPSPDIPHHSIRVFPPTDICASAHYDQVLRPSGRTTMAVSLEGLSNKPVNEDVIECWRLKKASWKLEETVRTVVKACPRHHIPSLSSENADARNRAVRTETRVLGDGSIPQEWKAEYSAEAGHVDLEFDFGLHPQRQQQHHHHHHAEPPRFACDVSMNATGPTGSEVTVSHSLMLELVVARARAAIARPDVATDTGTGRILRMRFRVFLSDEGTGVAWDDEAPPLYTEVPPSPPGYDGEWAGGGVEVVACGRGSEEGVVEGDGEGEGEGEEEAVYAARSSGDVR